MHLPEIPYVRTSSGALSGLWYACFPQLRRAFNRHRLLAVLVGGYATIALGMNLGFSENSADDKLSGLLWNFITMLPSMLYFLLMWRYLTMRFRIPAAERKGWLKADVKHAMTDPERLASAAVGIVLMLMMMISFAQLKRLIPIIQPFSWGSSLMALDQTLHFGTDPWRIVDTVLGNPFVITGITGAYNFWLFLMYFSLIFACFSMAKGAERMQYLVAFILTWAIGGNLIATVFSSAGPVYFERLGLGDHYAPLMAMLHQHAATQPLTATGVQEMLWSFYAAPDSLSGISAFPSMHVASTVLMACYARAYDRRAGWVLMAFATVIMLGSVLLAWHYAVDGYVGAAVAIASWWVAGRMVRRFGGFSSAMLTR